MAWYLAVFRYLPMAPEQIVLPGYIENTDIFEKMAVLLGLN